MFYLKKKPHTKQYLKFTSLNTCCLYSILYPAAIFPYYYTNCNSITISALYFIVIILYNDVFFIQTLFHLNSSLKNLSCFFSSVPGQHVEYLQLSTLCFYTSTFSCCASILLLLWTILFLWRKTIFFCLAAFSLFWSLQGFQNTHLLPHLFQNCLFIGNLANVGGKNQVGGEGGSTEVCNFSLHRHLLLYLILFCFFTSPPSPLMSFYNSNIDKKQE